ncbi:hypothetical protein [Nodularia spumigena]|jgi:hypothetical protein|uniref:Uncharacterized protein n=1 Tax=Nodularia spumigena UHCC 0060 TaxID=3110300 RepID=A0ABU5UVH1_NODSP|nr:hypothetical protein [Nodularia spumigena]MEA5527305.1 hypothetical protein [Nodularia spumigena UHCC 0143]MEA5609540.1 hypothetical protein [Nodularia spumigena UHCC 0060]MEA5613400.1 hypothetical protein [Nodularia spumigena UHCC 0040]
MQPCQDRIDKDNPKYTFMPPIVHTPQQIEAGNKIVEILNNPNLTESEQREACWSVLNSQFS